MANLENIDKDSHAGTAGRHANVSHTNVTFDGNLTVYGLQESKANCSHQFPTGNAGNSFGDEVDPSLSTLTRILGDVPARNDCLPVAPTVLPPTEDEETIKLSAIKEEIWRAVVIFFSFVLVGFSFAYLYQALKRHSWKWPVTWLWERRQLYVSQRQSSSHHLPTPDLSLADSSLNDTSTSESDSVFGVGSETASASSLSRK
nr:uncharacterized protein LOC123757026 [Procambarus clarkii]